MLRTDRFFSASPEETACLGYELGRCLEDGDVVLLEGDLGAGKTQFSKGVARGLGVDADIVSPTFNILVAYEDGRIPLYHFDLYRLEDARELEDIDFYYMVDDSTPGACLIEWADRFPDEMPDGCIEVEISKAEDDEGSREVVIRRES